MVGPRKTALIATKERTTKDTQRIMQTTSLPHYQNKFETFGDPCLEEIKRESNRFAYHLSNLAPVANPLGYWLSLLGQSGAGKTMVARKILDRWKQQSNRYVVMGAIGETHLCRDGRFIPWEKHIGRMRDGEHNISACVQDIWDLPFCVLDDIGTLRDKTGFVADQLHQILSGRLDKPTVITSNMTLDQLGAVDVRISNRIIRGENRVVNVATMDYALRKVRQ